MPRKRTKLNPSDPTLSVMQPDAAGIDVGATEMYVAVPEDRDPQPVRCFATFTPDLHFPDPGSSRIRRTEDDFPGVIRERPGCPFGAGEKRKEFADAFVIAALETWCEENGEEMHVITKDGTFIEACEASDNLYPLKELADFVDLALRRDEYVERAVEYLQEHTEPIKDAVKEAIEDRYIYLKDEDGDGEATVNEIISLDVDDVVKSEGDTMVLRCSATVDLTASVSYDDPNQTYWDSEDKELYVGGYISADLERTVDVSAEVTILWENHADYVVEKVVINDGDPISVYADEDAETHWK